MISEFSGAAQKSCSICRCRCVFFVLAKSTIPLCKGFIASVSFATLIFNSNNSIRKANKNTVFFLFCLFLFIRHDKVLLPPLVYYIVERGTRSCFCIKYSSEFRFCFVFIFISSSLYFIFQFTFIIRNMYVETTTKTNNYPNRIYKKNCFSIHRFFYRLNKEKKCCDEKKNNQNDVNANSYISNCFVALFNIVSFICFVLFSSMHISFNALVI